MPFPSARVFRYLILGCLCALAIVAQQPSSAIPERDIKLERAPTTAGHKYALVFGNNEYRGFRPLQNAVRDAQAMGDALKDVGFTVDLHTNANFREMEMAINRFLDQLTPNDTALLYYAGHGVQIDNENYLIPVDLEAKQQADVRYGAYSASKLHDKVQETGAKLKIFIFDACRNNPFRTGTRGIGDGNGLAYMSSGRGSYIAFATAPNRVAYERKEDQNGLFTKHLLTNLRQPGLTLSEVFDRTRDEVDAESGGQQIPWSSTSVIGQFYFRVPVPVAPVAAPQPIIKEVVREVPKEVIREVIREVPKEVTVIKEVPKEVIREVRVTEAPAGQVKRSEKDKQDYAWIPPGTFLMGCTEGDDECTPDEQPQHPVEITRGFWIGVTEVEVKSYQHYLEQTGGKLPKATMDNPKWKFTDHPMTHVSWEQAQAYCTWGGGRLPSEAEWEFAARGASTSNPPKRYPWGAETSHEKANYDGRQGADKYDYTSPVKTFEPNGYGLYDMAGNVWEWVLDWYAPDAYGQPSGPAKDPKGPATGAEHVIRGGGWYSKAKDLRVSARWHRPQESNEVGFRCVKESW